MDEIYDVIVIGAGHAGCEAALAAARMGCRTLILTMNLDTIGLMPCNPSIGGPAKGHLVREIDALGGEMARAIDDTFIHIRTLNTGKGPAVQALRAQADKAAYHLRMKKALETQPGLDLKQAMVDSLLVEPVSHQPSGNGQQASGTRTQDSELRTAHTDLRTQNSELSTQHSRACGVVTSLGRRYFGKTVVLTTGTSLAGRVIVGDQAYSAGRSGEQAATVLSQSLRNLGFRLGRLKTGTPPRVDVRTIDFSKTELIQGHLTPLHFGYWTSPEVDRGPFPKPNPYYPRGEEIPWRQQLPCFLVYTNETTHQIIRDNLDRAPLFSGVIEGIGTRYCPSIEDKIVRFAHKERHQLFLEPEGWETGEVYVQGANTSLPEDVQLQMLRSVPALAKAEIVRVGYAIEYDYIPSNQITAWLETKLVAGLYLAGQINGTSGYEEAAGQGLIAGINAALAVKGQPPLILERSQAYLGVMIDDLVTSDILEPYRLLTSRAEHRLLLRQDNADERLTPIGHRLGLIDEERFEMTVEKYRRVAREIERLKKIWLTPSLDFNQRLIDRGVDPISKNMSASSLLCRQEIDYRTLLDLLEEDSEPEAIGEQVEIRIKYEAYIRKQEAQAERAQSLEQLVIPENIRYSEITGLRNEAKEKLERFRPATVGMASRIGGVTPADIALLLVTLEKIRRQCSHRGSERTVSTNEVSAAT